MIDIYDVTLSYADEDNICFTWNSNIGWGELQITKDGSDKWVADTEAMCNNDDKHFIKQVFDKWLEDIEVIR